MQTVDTQSFENVRDTAGYKRVNQYVILSRLGEGAYGKVKLVRDERTKRLYVRRYRCWPLLVAAHRCGRARP